MSQVKAVDTLLTTKTHILSILQRRLTKAQEIMKKVVNLHRCDVTYSMGDWVYVRLRPYQ